MKVTKIYKVLIGAVVGLAFVGLGFFIRGCGKSPDAPPNFNFETDWKPEVPQFIQNKIKTKYAQSIKNQRAMLQYAHALWVTLEPGQDLETTLNRIDRAIYCTAFREIPYQDIQDLDAEIFFTDELTRKYLEWNQQLAGIIVPGRDYDETTCD